MALNMKNIAEIDIKDLNQLIKDGKFTAEEAKQIKQTRRLLKMCKYNKDQRDKKKIEKESLEAERDSLQQEYEFILKEVQILKEKKLDLELLAILDHYQQFEAFYNLNL